MKYFNEITEREKVIEMELDQSLATKLKPQYRNRCTAKVLVQALNDNEFR